MSRTEVILTGFGGQGIVLSGTVLARAAVYDRKEVVQTQSYGPEARGGACRAEVIVSDDTIYYPFVEEADILIAMSQEALDKYINKIKTGGRLIVDSTISRIPQKDGIKLNKVAATSIASEKLGKTIVANIIMLGALTSLTGIVSREAIEKAVRESIPGRGAEEVNLKALEEGYLHS